MKFLLIAESSPELPTTWSGVPNHLVKALRAAGHECETACYDTVGWIKWPRIFYNRIWRKVFHPGINVSFDHTWLAMTIMSFWLRREARRHAGLDAVIVMNYEFNAAGIKIPVIMIHDWFQGYGRLERELTRAERRQIKIQVRCVKSSAFSIALYPKACEWMQTLCGDKMRYICNPVNIDFEPDAEEWTKERLNSKHILCIGGSYYRENVEKVCRAVEEIPGVEVDVIGVKDVVHPESVKVNFYGYLDKRDPKQNDEYNRLLRQARCVVNVRSGWGGGSSIAEALYCYCPVIVGNYPDIVGMYGSNAVFGYYCLPDGADMLKSCLRKILSLSTGDYKVMALNAHSTVAQSDYCFFIKGLIEHLKMGGHVK